jgi:5-methylcytosine-specific restriction endonuclease McrA
MSSQKKVIRNKFRDDCFKRDNYKCVKCEFKSSQEKAQDELDAHHITSRTEMPSGGYVKENGITLCKDNCHIKAEEYHSTGIAALGFSIDDLYTAIRSSHTQAIAASKKL